MQNSSLQNDLLVVDLSSALQELKTAAHALVESWSAGNIPSVEICQRYDKAVERADRVILLADS